MPCAMKVAHATPATPQWNTITNTASSATFPREEAIRKYRGVLLSPRLLKIPVVTLYINKNRNPAV